MDRLGKIVVILSLISLHLARTNGYRDWRPQSQLSGQNGAELIGQSNQELDLTTLLDPSTDYHTEVFSQALDLITNLQTAPSCTRTATSSLLTSCRSIKTPARGSEDSSRTAENALDKVKSIYAARLAVCELSEAHATIPTGCAPLLPVVASSRQDGYKGLFKQRRRAGRSQDNTLGGGEVNETQLGECLRALESRPQGWTSYSNARQNAFVMCEASRSMIERDELLELYKSMTETNSDLNSALLTSLEDSHKHLTSQKTFAATVHNFQLRLMQDLEQNRSVSKAVFSLLTEDIDSGLRSILKKVVSAGQATELYFSGLNKNLENSSDAVNDLHKTVNKITDEFTKESSDIALRQQQDWQSGHELALSVHETLETIRSRDLKNFLVVFGGMSRDLEVTQEKLLLMLMRQDTIDERLSGLNKAFETIQSKAESISSTQDLQAKSVQDLHISLDREVQAALQVIGRISEDASNLQSTIGDAAAKVKDLQILNGVAALFGRWTWVILALLGFHLTGRSITQAVAVTMVLFTLAGASGSPFNLRDALSISISALPSQAVILSRYSALGVACAVILFAILSCALFLRLRRSTCAKIQSRSQQAILSNLDA